MFGFSVFIVYEVPTKSVVDFFAELILYDDLSWFSKVIVNLSSFSIHYNIKQGYRFNIDHRACDY